MSAVTVKRFFVAGRVQGVWFRASTQRAAEQLGICGHALNLPDGRVEVLACGSSAAVDQLQRWLHTGPPLARVGQVETEAATEADVTAPGRFICG